MRWAKHRDVWPLANVADLANGPCNLGGFRGY